ncbi:MAG: acyl--CoA ligase [Clostridia bacterium]|nr:acyl--CoA ligase [Clostridia bacterium]
MDDARNMNSCMVEPGDMSCYDYYKACTVEYGTYYCQQHFGKWFLNTKIVSDMDALAAYARIELGLKPGDVYSVFMPTTVQSIVAFYALNKVGVIVNFIHPLLPPEVVKETITSLHSKGVMVLDLLSKKYADMLNSLNLPILVCHSSDYAGFVKKTAVGAGEKAIKKIYPKLNNREEYMTAIKRFRNANVKTHCDCDQTAVYLNGGGTTGKSKTIKLTSRAINEIVYRMSKLDRIHRPGEEAEIIVLPLFHCFGLSVAMHMAMCNGARLIPMMNFDARLFNRLMKKNCVVGILGIPVMFKKLMDEKHFDGKWLKNIRLSFCGGDDAPQQWLDEFNSYLEKWGAVGRLRQGYGLTEVGSVCCTCTNTSYKENSIGTPIEGVMMDVWDDDCKPLPVGEIGELVVAGPTVMSGYYTEDGHDGEGLYTDENGVQWVRSGDLGYRDEDGFYYFSGRKKRVIIISGYNVYPSDIEKHLTRLGFIREACCVKGWSAEGKPIIRLFVVYNDKTGDRAVYEKTILAQIKEHFSCFSVPREIVELDKLPETPLMKIDFLKLTQDKPGDPVYTPPVGQKESLLAI